MTVLETKIHESIEYWVETLGLQHWEFTVEVVSEFDDGVDAEASCAAHAYYDQATLRFNKRLKGSEIDYCVVHELVHALMRDYDEAADDALQYLGYNIGRGFALRVNATKENLVDRVTRILLELGKSDRVRP